MSDAAASAPGGSGGSPGIDAGAVASGRSGGGPAARAVRNSAAVSGRNSAETATAPFFRIGVDAPTRPSRIHWRSVARSHGPYSCPFAATTMNWSMGRNVLPADERVKGRTSAAPRRPQYRHTPWPAWHRPSPGRRRGCRPTRCASLPAGRGRSAVPRRRRDSSRNLWPRGCGSSLAGGPCTANQHRAVCARLD